MDKNSVLCDVISAELADILGIENFTTREVDRLCYVADHFWISKMWVDRGRKLPLPDFVVWPNSAQEVSKILKLANRYKIPVIPYGGGSGAQGGTVPLFGGIVIDLKRMDKILRIDKKSYTATALPGINGQILENQLNKEGVMLAHYPASQYAATLGGYVASRGSGVLSTKYGKAEDMVISMEIVLPQGEIIRTLPVPNHAAGPGLLQLFIGSEGVFGVITELTMRIDPIPEVRKFRGYLFADLVKGLEAGRRIMTQRLKPCVLRLYDASSTQRFIKRVLNLDAEGNFMIVGVDGDAPQVDYEESAIQKICLSLNAIDWGSAPGEHWWKHRYDFYFPPFAPSLPEMYGTTDTVTNFDNIYNLYLAKKQVIEDGYKEWGSTYTAHFSHWFPWGVMIYDRFFIKRPPQDPREALLLHNKIWADSVRASIAHGGVLNEHHGIGFKLGWLMPEQYGSAWPMLKNLKNMLDPHGIMNPGKLGF